MRHAGAAYCYLLLVSAVFDAATAAQEVGDQAVVSGRTQPPAGGDPLLDSFKALSLILAVGQEVIVRDDTDKRLCLDLGMTQEVAGQAFPHDPRRSIPRISCSNARHRVLVNTSLQRLVQIRTRCDRPVGQEVGLEGHGNPVIENELRRDGHEPAL